MIPENELSKAVDIEIDETTGGPTVNQCFETILPGVYSCGNCLQVYDTVDALSIDAKHAGIHAAEFVHGQKHDESHYVSVKAGKGIRYVIPQRVTKSGLVDFTFRVVKPQQSVVLYLNADGKEIYRKKFRWVNPANMVGISVDIPDEKIKSASSLEVFLDA